MSSEAETGTGQSWNSEEAEPEVTQRTDLGQSQAVELRGTEPQRPGPSGKSSEKAWPKQRRGCRSTPLRPTGGCVHVCERAQVGGGRGPWRTPGL